MRHWCSAHAADVGFRLVHHETDSGQMVWERQRGTDAGLQFLTRRFAIHWMSEFLERESAVAFVSDTGQFMA